MKVIENLQAWQQLRSKIENTTIGFVPTMGNLHQGHLSLFQQSLEDNHLTVASIFVNPTQFNNQQDFIHYPKTLEADLAALESLGVDYCLLPTKAQIYPDDYQYQITEKQLSLQMEGNCRPGHFDGVLTIVMKLLMLVQANRAYFGEKDYQQFQLVKGMAGAFFMPTEILSKPTIRDNHGLALSSRNNRLSPEGIQQAQQFAKLFHQSTKSVTEIQVGIQQLGINIDYIEEHNNRRFAAVFVEGIRLIDNYSI
jgi:pantoate--beta-alanine ligase